MRGAWISYALLSSFTDIPLDQGLAVTGSVNQFGQIQPVGGINEKVEGFFDVCRARGLTGRQGVLIPESNARHLMLREDVVQAVRDEQFHVHAIATVDEGLSLRALPSGTQDATLGSRTRPHCHPVEPSGAACECWWAWTRAT